MTRHETNTVFFPHFPPVMGIKARHWFLAMADRRRQRLALARLDERLLQDVGITPAEAAAECRRRD